MADDLTSRLLATPRSPVPEIWTRRYDDVYAILSGSHMVSVHKPPTPFIKVYRTIAGIEPGNFAQIDADAALAVSQPASIQSAKQGYTPVLETYFLNGKFMLGLTYTNGVQDDKIIESVDQTLNFIKDTAGVPRESFLELFTKHGLPVSCMAEVVELLK